MSAKKKRVYLHSRNVPGNTHDAVRWVNETLTDAGMVVAIHPTPGFGMTVVVWRSTTKPQEQT